MRHDGYAPLGAYAPIGDCRTLALVCADGAIDWLAAPALDTPPVLAAILDPEHGGSFGLAPEDEAEVSRWYLEGTNVLQTEFRTGTGVLRVTDALNRGMTGLLPWGELARRVECTSGRVPLRWRVTPGTRFDTARPWTSLRDGVPVCHVADQHLAVCAFDAGTPQLDACGVGGACTLRAGEAALVALVMADAEPVRLPGRAAVEARLDATADTWRRWSDQIRYDGPWREAVLRAVLALKLLVFQPTGAIASAPTTSLPEVIGGKKNFDYRFGWIRDASFTIDALDRLNLDEEVTAALSWLLSAVGRTAPDLRAFYLLSGEVAAAEMSSPDLPGYRRTRPVHVGNAAAAQPQLGAFGDLFDAVWRYASRGNLLDAATAGTLVDLADRACDVWAHRDSGIWELGEHRHYTISKIGCWTALDRAVRLAEAGQLAAPHVDRWRMERQAIRTWVDAHCWSQAKQAYTFYAGGDDLDAAVLLAARTGFCDGDDPRLHSTIDAIVAELADGPLVFRYSPMVGVEGAFVVCSFWLVEALTHAGRLEEAHDVMEGTLSHASGLGLFGEQLDPRSHDVLGNFPQGLSLLGLIMAAVGYAEAVSGR